MPSSQKLPHLKVHSVNTQTARSRVTRRLGFTAALSGVAALAAVLAAPSASSPGPSFTSAQALKGQSDYTQNCSGCHGVNLQGGAGPTLIGSAGSTLDP